MKKLSLLLSLGVLLFVSAVIVAGCGAISASQGTQTVTPSPVLNVSLVNHADVCAGDKIQFVLPANPTTGYEWNVTSSSGLTVVSEYVSDTPKTAEEEMMTGVGGKQIYTVSAPKAGTYTFTAVYKRSWETGEPDMTFTQTIIVHDADGHTAEENPVMKLVFDGDMHLRAGDVVRVTAAGNPTTGYDWNTTAGSTVTVLNTAYVEDAHEEYMVGYGGTFVWDVTAEKAGTYLFDAEYKRPWEENVPAEDAFSFHLTFN
ncbi:MAG: protease inhibitor I42 family protein [Methanocorpusculum sp.]|nr:protease inhibitor I42 family protein [Methanocorpusculum sp.]